MAAGLERRRVDLDSQCQRDNRADAWAGGQPLAELVGIGCGIPFSIDLPYTVLVQSMRFLREPGVRT